MRYRKERRKDENQHTVTAKRPSRHFHASGPAPDGTAGKTRFLTQLFCCFIGGLLLLFLFLPKADFSDTERRRLARFPEVTTRNVLNGKFEDNMETYVSDHFPLRRFFVGLNSWTDLTLGRTLINGVYVGNAWWLMQEPPAVDEEILERNMQAIHELKESLGIPAEVLSVPATGYVMSAELPEPHLQYNDARITELARQSLSSGRLADQVEWVDVLPALLNASRQEQVYYRTDHHWTTTGAYEAYLVWAEQHGVSAPPRDAFAIDSYGGFRGTTYAKVLLWGTPPDSVELWQYPLPVTVAAMDAEKGMEPVVSDSFYDMAQLDGYDPYAVFFGGNHSVVRITNETPDASGRLLVIKDSYANCFVPFLARHYKEIVMIDPRYYRDVRAFIEAEPDFDEILFVYGIGQLTEDEDLGQINF